MSNEMATVEQGKTARVLSLAFRAGPDGKHSEVPLEAIEPGDRFATALIEQRFTYSAESKLYSGWWNILVVSYTLRDRAQRDLVTFTRGALYRSPERPRVSDQEVREHVRKFEDRQARKRAALAQESEVNPDAVIG